MRLFPSCPVLPFFPHCPVSSDVSIFQMKAYKFCRLITVYPYIKFLVLQNRASGQSLVRVFSTSFISRMTRMIKCKNVVNFCMRWCKKNEKTINNFNQFRVLIQSRKLILRNEIINCTINCIQFRRFDSNTAIVSVLSISYIRKPLESFFSVKKTRIC